MAASNHATDATVLLTGAHVDMLVDSLRSIRVVMQQLDASNRKLEETSREATRAMRELTIEIKKQRKSR